VIEQVEVAVRDVGRADGVPVLGRDRDRALVPILMVVRVRSSATASSMPFM